MASLPKRPTPATTPKKPKDDTVLLEGTTIEVLDGIAKVHVSVDLKLSKNYQSGGAQMGLEFKTHADQAETAARTAMDKVKGVVEQYMSRISKVVEEMA